MILLLTADTLNSVTNIHDHRIIQMVHAVSLLSGKSGQNLFWDGIELANIYVKINGRFDERKTRDCDKPILYLTQYLRTSKHLR
jgi:hypothetical protein